MPVPQAIDRLKKKWRYWKLGAVEKYYFQLKDNNTYPFQDLGDGKSIGKNYA